MYKCNICGAIFDKPLEQRREVEYYSIPFGNDSESYGGGYYDCCPECESEDFDRYSEQNYIEDLENEVEILEKALELACRIMLVPDGYCEDMECPNLTCKDCLIEQFKTKAKEIKDGEKIN